MTPTSPTGSSSPEPAFRVRGLGKRFLISTSEKKENFLSTSRRLLTGEAGHRVLWALRDLDLDLDRGEILGVIGPNGAGKSTLLLLLGGILTPTEGTLEVRGRTSQFFQLASGLQGRLTVKENFGLCAALLGIPPRRFREIFPAILEFSELDEYLYAKFGELSSGLAARVAFSTAVHADLDIILVDEALAVGDESFQAKCERVFRDFRERGKTMVVVSHSLNRIPKLCTRALYLSGGKPMFLGDPEKAVQRFLQDLGMDTGRSKTGEKSRLAAGRRELAAVMAEGSARKEQLNDVSKQLALKIEEFDALASQVESKRSEAEALEAQVSAKRKEADSLAAQTASKRKELEVLHKEIRAERDGLVEDRDALVRGRDELVKREQAWQEAAEGFGSFSRNVKDRLEQISVSLGKLSEKYRPASDAELCERFSKAVAGRLDVPAGQVRLFRALGFQEFLKAAVADGRLGRALKPHDEVIVPADVSSLMLDSLLMCGLIPVFVDLRPGTWGPDLERVSAALSDRTGAVVIRHSNGVPCDPEQVAVLCRERGLAMIEDVAGTLGGAWGGKALGTFGALGFFNFNPRAALPLSEVIVTVLPRSEDGPGSWTASDDRAVSPAGPQCGKGLELLQELAERTRVRRDLFAAIRRVLGRRDEWFFPPEIPDRARPAFRHYPAVLRPAAPFGRERLLERLRAGGVAGAPMRDVVTATRAAYRDVPHRVAGKLENAGTLERGGVAVDLDASDTDAGRIEGVLGRLLERPD